MYAVSNAIKLSAKIRESTCTTGFDFRIQRQTHKLDEFGSTKLDWVENNNTGVVKLLLDRGAVLDR